MTSLRESFRTWWQPPRRTQDRIAHRQVTVLELFYDLVYVVLIADLAPVFYRVKIWFEVMGAQAS